MNQVQIEKITSEDQNWIKGLIKNRWGSGIIVSKGKIHKIGQSCGFIAKLDGKNVGLITYSIENSECQIITLDSLIEGKGIGTQLVGKVLKLAKEENCKRVWLVTTNDNTDALKFYQKRDFVLVAIYPNMIEKSRKIKPEIPNIGANGIPIRDEIELELNLEN